MQHGPGKDMPIMLIYDPTEWNMFSCMPKHAGGQGTSTLARLQASAGEGGGRGKVGDSPFLSAPPPPPSQPLGGLLDYDGLIVGYDCRRWPMVGSASPATPSSLPPGDSVFPLRPGAPSQSSGAGEKLTIMGCMGFACMA